MAQVCIVRDEHNQSKGYGFAKMEQPEQHDQIQGRYNYQNLQFEIRKSISKAENDLTQHCLKECKVFFNKLDQKLNENDLLWYFEKFGPVDEIKLLRNVKTQVSRRCGFILFRNIESKLKALKKKWHAINSKKFTIEDCQFKN